MKAPRQQLPGPSRRGASAGFTLVSAIFVLVILVVLGGSVVTLVAVQHNTSAVRIQTVRATLAARAGLEWAIRRIAMPASCNGSFTLDGTSVTVSCTSSTHTFGGADRNYFVVTASATSGSWGGTDYVSRQLQAKVLGP